MREMKDENYGEIEVTGPELAQPYNKAAALNKAAICTNRR